MPDKQGESVRIGLLNGIGAFVLWGLCPLYFALVAHVAPLEVLIHRVVWSVLLLLAVILIQGNWRETAREFTRPRRLAILALSSLLVSTNWFLFIRAVGSGQTLEASFGYFLNPVLTVALGVVFLKESLSRWQIACLVFATIGVAYQGLTLGRIPWVSLGLAASFGFYSLVRKRLEIGSIPGLFVETTLLAVPCLAYGSWLHSHGKLVFTNLNGSTDLLLLAAGLVTSVPLVMFAIGARRLPLSWMGLLQFIVPSLQLLVAILFLGERLTTTKLISFALVWVGLAVLVFGALRGRRRHLPQT